MKAWFFENGNTMFFDDAGQQMPDLQKSWFMLYVQFLTENGIDPLAVEFVMPNRRGVTIFKTADGGYNWQLTRRRGI